MKTNISHIIIFAVLIVLMNASCEMPDLKKERRYTIDGYLKEAGSETPVSNAVVELMRQKEGLDIAMYETLVTTTTGGNGYFAINYSSPEEILYIHINPEDTFLVNGSKHSKYPSLRMILSKEINHFGDIDIPSYGIVKIELDNSRLSEGDTLILNVSAGSIFSSERIFPPHPQVSYLCERTFLAYGNQFANFSWDLKRNGENRFTRFSDSVFCIPFKETSYRLHYD